MEASLGSSGDDFRYILMTIDDLVVLLYRYFCVYTHPLCEVDDDPNVIQSLESFILDDFNFCFLVGYQVGISQQINMSWAI